MTVEFSPPTNGAAGKVWYRRDNGVPVAPAMFTVYQSR
jgi:hypothetical protein